MNLLAFLLLFIPLAAGQIASVSDSESYFFTIEANEGEAIVLPCIYWYNLEDKLINQTLNILSYKDEKQSFNTSSSINFGRFKNSNPDALITDVVDVSILISEVTTDSYGFYNTTIFSQNGTVLKKCYFNITRNVITHAPFIFLKPTRQYPMVYNNWVYNPNENESVYIPCSYLSGKDSLTKDISVGKLVGATRRVSWYDRETVSEWSNYSVKYKEKDTDDPLMFTKYDCKNSNVVEFGGTTTKRNSIWRCVIISDANKYYSFSLFKLSKEIPDVRIQEETNLGLLIKVQVGDPLNFPNVLEFTMSSSKVLTQSCLSSKLLRFNNYNFSLIAQDYGFKVGSNNTPMLKENNTVDVTIKVDKTEFYHSGLYTLYVYCNDTLLSEEEFTIFVVPKLYTFEDDLYPYYYQFRKNNRHLLKQEDIESGWQEFKATIVKPFPTDGLDKDFDMGEIVYQYDQATSSCYIRKYNKSGATIKWFVKGKELPSNSAVNREILQQNTYAMHSVLNIVITADMDKAPLTCKACHPTDTEPKCLETSKSISTESLPTVDIEVTTNENQQVVLLCTARKTPPSAKLLWYVNGHYQNFTITESKGDLNTKISVYIPFPREADVKQGPNDYYECVLSDDNLQSSISSFSRISAPGKVGIIIVYIVIGLTALVVILSLAFFLLYKFRGNKNKYTPLY